ncbi:MAG: winged helix-turn-helix domain-containing protein [Caldilineaceae bacterium]|nr:winged helix-turn-helix domain-containing protein [Caldilineaceae bacterium]
MAQLAIRLFGSFAVTCDGNPVTTFEYDKVRALLAYLAVESDRPHPRATLADLLWPGYPERSARQNLSQALYKLRRALSDNSANPPYLLITPQTLQWSPLSDFWLDTAAFATAVDATKSQVRGALATCDECRAQL